MRPGYTFDVRMVSDRTERLEYGNGENLRTYFVSDGCNCLVKRGDEYFNIFPAWNWTRIPGTTIPQVGEVPMAKSSWMQMGTSKFAGGVSDSIYGATAYVYDDEWAGVNTHARKSWFFFDNEIVCLGAGISSDNASPVVTTLNQCVATAGQTISYVGADGKCATADGDLKSAVVRAVRYDGVGYVFPDGGDVEAEVKTQSGSWRTINHTQVDEVVEKSVFTLSLNHGVKPSAATYSYIVVPESADAPSLASYGKHVAVLSNTSVIQAVQQRDLGIWQFVFYSAATYKDRNVTVTVDKPCAVMLRRRGDGTLWMHVADPSQKQQPITVAVKMKGELKKSVSTVCDFTGTGIYAGATKAYRLR